MPRVGATDVIAHRICEDRWVAVRRDHAHANELAFSDLHTGERHRLSRPALHEGHRRHPADRLIDRTGKQRAVCAHLSHRLRVLDEQHERGEHRRLDRLDRTEHHHTQLCGDLLRREVRLLHNLGPRESIDQQCGQFTSGSVGAGERLRITRVFHRSGERRVEAVDPGYVVQRQPDHLRRDAHGEGGGKCLGELGLPADSADELACELTDWRTELALDLPCAEGCLEGLAIALMLLAVDGEHHPAE